MLRVYLGENLFLTMHSFSLLDKVLLKSVCIQEAAVRNVYQQTVSKLGKEVHQKGCFYWSHAY